MPITIYNRLLLAKIEATKGTDSTPVVGSNAIRIKSGNITLTQDALARSVVKQSMGNLAHLVGKQVVQLELEIELKSSGAAGTPPEASPLFQSCSLNETIVAVTSVTYDPLTIGGKSCSIYWFEDGLKWVMLGAVGKQSFSANIGAVGGWKITMYAAYVAPTAVACPTGAVYQASAPIVMSSADVINDGAVIKVGAFTLDGGEVCTHHYTTGGSEFVVSGREPKMTLTKDSISTAAEWTALNAGTTASMSATFGAVAGARLIVTAPVAKRESVDGANRVDRPTLNIKYGCYETTGDDQFRYLFN